MMNAAMMIAPAPQANNIKAGEKAATGQGQLFGQALAQQEQQVVFQSAEQEQAGLPGFPGKGVLLSRFSEFLGKDTGQLLGLQPEQQALLDQMDVEVLEQMDVQMLEDLALLLEQGTIPNSMDTGQLRQLVDLVEEVLPEWQLHNQVVVAEQVNPLELPSEQQGSAAEQKIEELIAWFSQYQEQHQQQSRNSSGHTISAEFPPGQLVAGQRLEQVRERLAQLHATRSEAGNTVKAEGEAKGQQLAATAARASDLIERQEIVGSPLEARFNDLLKPRPTQASQLQAGQVIVNGRQAQSQQQSQQTSVNQVPMDDSADFFANVADKSASQVPLTQTAMNVRQVFDGLHPQHNLLPGQQAPVAAAAQGITAPVALAAPFSTSQPVVDSQIFDQVVTHLSGSDKGDMGRMVLRLHPAELGSLRIELMVEGDRVRANLHAQTQQVQEVLERNLGQLRNALAEQGLKIDHFQVSTDTRQNHQQGQAEDMAHQRHAAEQSAQHRRADKEEPLAEDQAIPLAHLIQNGGKGISLHV